MTASYRLIDYSLRPAKFAERKMLCEMFTRLRVFGSLESYRYVGFGSIWYADCVLFHRTLGIEDIISMERERNHEPRFEFNNPYGGIELLMGSAAEILPSLDWMHRSIIWLDYDDPLSPSILDDIRTVASRVGSGSALAITVQAQKLVDSREVHESPVDIETVSQFRDYFGDARTPGDLNSVDLEGWRLARSCRRAIREEIENALVGVNAGRSRVQQLQFRQVGAFEYADGAKMCTIVGVFVDEGQQSIFHAADFGSLWFFKEGLEAVRIKVPLLTPHEMRYLDRSLPLAEHDDIDFGPIPESEGKRYAKLYRYLPNFASFEL